jgi:hypothetical protein
LPHAPIMCPLGAARKGLCWYFQGHFSHPSGYTKVGGVARYLLNLSCCSSGKLYFSVLVNFCKKLFGEVCAAGGACLNSDPGFVTITVTIAVCNYDCMQALSASAFSYY